MQKKNLKTPKFLFFSDEFLRRKNIFSQAMRKARRLYFSIFHKEYVQESIKTRQGDCNRCGACCALVYRCPFLGKDSQDLPICRVYGTLQPQQCKNYPFDSIDNEVEDCTFKFEDQKLK